MKRKGTRNHRFFNELTPLANKIRENARVPSVVTPDKPQADKMMAAQEKRARKEAKRCGQS